MYVDSRGAETTEPEVEGYAYSANDDNGGSLYTVAQIKKKLIEGHQNQHHHSYGDMIMVANNWVKLTEYFNSNYSGTLIKIAHKPKLEDGVYTVDQRERFKASSAAVLDKLKLKGSEIESQIEKLALTLDASPWTPKEYQVSHLAGLKVNLDELTKYQSTLVAVIAGYDKLLVTNDPEKLTDPKA